MKKVSATGSNKVNRSATKKEYWDLVATGFGYLNRISDHQGESGPFKSVNIAALRGKLNDPNNTYLNLVPAGEDILNLVEALRADVEDGKKVLLAFSFGDFYPKPFKYQNGKNAGSLGANLNGKLIAISTIKVDGNVVYTAGEET